MHRRRRRSRRFATKLANHFSGHARDRINWRRRFQLNAGRRGEGSGVLTYLLDISRVAVQQLLSNSERLCPAPKSSSYAKFTSPSSEIAQWPLHVESRPNAPAGTNLGFPNHAQNAPPRQEGLKPLRPIPLCASRVTLLPERDKTLRWKEATLWQLQRLSIGANVPPWRASRASVARMGI